MLFLQGFSRNKCLFQLVPPITGRLTVSSGFKFVNFVIATVAWMRVTATWYLQFSLSRLDKNIERWSDIHGYGSIPINIIFRGMNIHLPAILMFTRGTRFWHTATLKSLNCCKVKGTCSFDHPQVNFGSTSISGGFIAIAQWFWPTTCGGKSTSPFLFAIEFPNPRFLGQFM